MDIGDCRCRRGVVVSLSLPPPLSSRQLARKLLQLHLDDVVARHDNEAEVARRHVKCNSGALGGLLREVPAHPLVRRLAVLVRVSQHDVAVLQ